MFLCLSYRILEIYPRNYVKRRKRLKAKKKKTNPQKSKKVRWRGCGRGE